MLGRQASITPTLVSTTFQTARGTRLTKGVNDSFSYISKALLRNQEGERLTGIVLSALSLNHRDHT